MAKLLTKLTPEQETRSADLFLNAACEWAVSNPWRIAQVIVLCVTAPCWVERLLP